jgi:kynureninase
MESKATWQQQAANYDRTDPVGKFRNEFKIPEAAGKQRIYFLGNSLGLQPKSTAKAIEGILEQWSREGVESFFLGDDSWMTLHNRLLGTLADITGSLPHELSVMNQLSVNIHLMLVSFYRPDGKKRKILMESKAFPSDQYAVRSHLRYLGLNPDEIIVEVNSGKELEAISDEDIINVINRHSGEIALVFLGGINFYTGQLFDLGAVALAAKKAGALVGLDLAHAVGNVRLDLHDWEIDFACWCSYKYLNGGPGAVGGIYIHEKYHHQQSIQRLTGWWGNKQESRFQMKERFEPEVDATAWQLSTPPVMLLAALQASLSIFDAAGWQLLLEKQKLMQKCLAEWVESLGGTHFRCITPASRGCQLSLLFPAKGRVVYEQLFEKGFMVDWREPNVIRLAPVPLYNTFTEIWQFSEALKEIIQELFSAEVQSEQIKIN